MKLSLKDMRAKIDKYLKSLTIEDIRNMGETFGFTLVDADWVRSRDRWQNRKRKARFLKRRRQRAT